MPKKVVWNQTSHLISAIFRFLWVPGIVVYIKQDYWWNDWFVYVFIGTFAVIGGYIRTLIFTIGPQVVSLEVILSRSLFLSLSLSMKGHHTIHTHNSYTIHTHTTHISHTIHTHTIHTHTIHTHTHHSHTQFTHTIHTHTHTHNSYTPHTIHTQFTFLTRSFITLGSTKGQPNP